MSFQVVHCNNIIHCNKEKHRLAIYLHNVIFSFIVQSATPQNETLWISIIFPQFFPLAVSQIVFIFLLLWSFFLFCQLLMHLKKWGTIGFGMEMFPAQSYLGLTHVHACHSACVTAKLKKPGAHKLIFLTTSELNTAFFYSFYFNYMALSS